MLRLSAPSRDLTDAWTEQIATNNVASGQSLYQVTKDNLCFVVCILIFALIGMVVEQIQTLERLSIIGSCSVFLNVSVIIMSLVFIAITPPNYDAASAAYGLDINPPAPVSHPATVSAPLFSKVNGAMNMVFAWYVSQSPPSTTCADSLWQGWSRHRKRSSWS